MISIKFNNIKNLKYKKLKKFSESDKKDVTNKYSDLIEICDKNINFCNEEDNFLKCDIFRPFFWIKPIDMDIPEIKLKISLDNPFIEYNGKIIPSFMDYYKFKIDNGIYISESYIEKFDFPSIIIFKKLYNLELSKKKNLVYLGIQYDYYLDKKHENLENDYYLINILKNIYLKPELTIDFVKVKMGYTKNKFVKISDKTFVCDYKEFNKINKKYDFGLILLRKYHSDSLLLTNNSYLERLQYTLNYINKSSNLHATWVIHFYGSYNIEFENIICSLTMMYDSVEIFSTAFERGNFNHIWINLNGYKGNTYYIDMFEKRLYTCEKSDEIKNNLTNLRTNLIMKTINNINFLQKSKIENFKINEFKNNIITFLINNKLPINILYNDLITNDFVDYHDLQLLIDFLNIIEISCIIEHKMNFNTFIYLIGIYNSTYKKKIEYVIDKPIINIEEYLVITSLDINIKYQINKIKQKETIAIFSKEYDKNIDTEYILINNILLVEIYDYFVFKSGKKYSILKKRKNYHK
jgi:hypothetical protein